MEHGVPPLGDENPDGSHVDDDASDRQEHDEEAEQVLVGEGHGDSDPNGASNLLARRLKS